MKKTLCMLTALMLIIALMVPAVAENSRKDEVLSFIASLDNKAIEGTNSYVTSYDDMVAYLTEKGVIAADAEPVDINTTAGYVKKYDGTTADVVAIADRACDFGGVYLIWFDLVNGSDYTANYVGMTNNSGVIVVMGGMYTMQTAIYNGCYALAFAEDYDDAAKSAATKALKGVNKDKPYLSLYNGTDLAAALQKAKLIAVTDFAAPTDLNKVYTYVAEGKDWVGQYNAETNPNGTESGYSEPYDKTYYVSVATTAMKYGDISIYWYDTADSMFAYYAPACTLASLQENVQEDGSSVGTLYQDIDGDWTFAPLTVNGTEYVEGGEVATFHVDALMGPFAIVVGE